MPPDFVSFRLSNHLLSATRFTAAEQAAAWMGAVQSQDYAGAKWAVGQRIAGGGEAQVEAALEKHALARAWVPRGTLHFVAAADLRWMTALLAPRLLKGNDRRYRQLELDEATLARSRSVIQAALQAEGALDRRQLLSALEGAGIATTGQRAPYLLQNATLHGLAFQGVTRSGLAVYHSLDRLPPAGNIEGEAALSELARRYFQSHGPASLDDFIWWSGLSAGEARNAVDLARVQLFLEQVDGRTMWRAENEIAAPPATPAAWLLSAFDEYVVAYRDRSMVLDRRHASRLEHGGMLSPCIVIDGKIAGIWGRSIKKNQVEIDLDFFVSPDAAQVAAVQVAAERFANFIGKAAVIRSIPNGEL